MKIKFLILFLLIIICISPFYIFSIKSKQQFQIFKEVDINQRLNSDLIKTKYGYGDHIKYVIFNTDIYNKKSLPFEISLNVFENCTIVIEECFVTAGDKDYVFKDNIKTIHDSHVCEFKGKIKEIDGSHVIFICIGDKVFGQITTEQNYKIIPVVKTDLHVIKNMVD